MARVSLEQDNGKAERRWRPGKVLETPTLVAEGRGVLLAVRHVLSLAQLRRFHLWHLSICLQRGCTNRLLAIIATSSSTLLRHIMAKTPLSSP
jgi:hypothetical protein